MFKKIKNILNIEDESILAIIPYGSNVYKNKKSEDLDFFVIVKENIELSINEKDIDITVLGVEQFLSECKSHTVRCMETIYTPENIEHYFITSAVQLAFKELKNIDIDLKKMRENFSKTTSNSYVKAKKKIIVEKDYDYMSSLKSLWHSIRIANFGSQILENSKIDFHSMNNLYKEIEKDYELYNLEDKEEMWLNINKKYKPLFNKNNSLFKKLCPK